MTAARQRLVIQGAVQGVGFRPFVYRLATELGLAGSVCNSPEGAAVELEGLPARIEQFQARLQQELPRPAQILGLRSTPLPPAGDTAFLIRTSESAGRPRVSLLPDLATCSDCLEELFDPRNRRYRYPFTNCTRCGPRFTIVSSLPYDRANTSMERFTMCRRCRAEYEDPADRRFHAQPNACPDCGPRLELWDQGGHRLSDDDEAVQAAAAAIRRGEIVAVKGLGGFHLMAAASCEGAVRELRRRKRRETKPFALMAPSLEWVRTQCEVGPCEADLLQSYEAPILLLRRLRSNHATVALAVAPEHPYLGVMLPYTPLHHLLMRELNTPVVATSGNLSDEPICFDEHDTLVRLGGIADLFLVHDRPILRPVDDSVLQVVLGRPMLLRRSRGYVPLPLPLDGCTESAPARSMLAVGAHLKNTLALSIGAEVVMSQHIGDLEELRAFDSFQEAASTLQHLHGLQPELIACDLHPGYRSTQWAEAQRTPLVRVQHHYAHVLACMAEHRLVAPVLGIAWDGTGDGGDGTIWGGEFLAITPDSFERFAHLRRFRLPGGEKAVREPRRAALGVLSELWGDQLADAHREPLRQSVPTLQAVSSEELGILLSMVQGGLNAPLTTSAGRLFDAVASLLGLSQQAGYEGQAAAALQFAAEEASAAGCYPFEVTPGGEGPPLIVDWQPTINAILEAVCSRNSSKEIAARFHNTLVEMIVAVARRWRGLPRRLGSLGMGDRRGTGGTVVLTGGCFQNRLLLDSAVRRLREEQFQVYWPERVPPNDGGIALGQVVAGRRFLSKE